MILLVRGEIVGPCAFGCFWTAWPCRSGTGMPKISNALCTSSTVTLEFLRVLSEIILSSSLVLGHASSACNARAASAPLISFLV